MPIYEYACTTCGHRFEVFQKMSDPPPSLCPSCGADEVRKLVSAASFVLKGGGWYKDHYGLKTTTESKGEGGSSGGSSPSSPSGDASPSSAPAAPAAPAAPSAPAPAAPVKP